MTRLDHDANVAPVAARSPRTSGSSSGSSTCTTTSRSTSTTSTRKLSDRTRVVAFPAAANSVGTAPDVRRVVELAHEAGALAWVDAVHYGPHGPIDVAAWGCDVLICSPYKFFGPHMGLAFGREDAAPELAPVQGAPGRRRAGRPPLRARHVPARAARGVRRRGRLRRIDSAGTRSARTSGRSASGSSPGSPARVTLHGLPTMEGRVPTFCFSVAGSHRAVRRGAPRRARRRRVVGQLLRARDDEAPRPGRGRRRGPGGDRPLQHGRGGRPAARRGRGARLRLLLLGGPKFLGRAVIDAALERGHEVTLFNRGTTGARALPGAGADRRRPRRRPRRRCAAASGTPSSTPPGYLPRLVGASAAPAGGRGRPLRLRVEHLRVRVVRRGRGRGLAGRGAHRARLGGHRARLRRPQGALRARGRGRASRAGRPRSGRG